MGLQVTGSVNACIFCLHLEQSMASLGLGVVTLVGGKGMEGNGILRRWPPGNGAYMQDFLILGLHVRHVGTQLSQGFILLSEGSLRLFPLCLSLSLACF